ncbi:MAG: preprotein translocase subunit SecG [Planctomycetes bacterium]|nr:preprotein translocase subunit SecG [Planctomycetota bacterium]MBU1518636.1 preprotein translocase subunit SecG [Planctomycetota bacterium]MBU2458144.1 preprotein translocase subunit SecG [Planctomycetota bacterium]MBU2596917.1 preprotein translocase subunit SecG [Planctomycetota bacterium]
MIDFALAAVPFVMKVVVALWAIIAVVLVLLVLIQKGRGGGLGSAFGGIGNSLLGTKTGDFLTWVTICLVAVWLLLSVVAAKWFKPQASEFLQSRPATSAPAAMPVQPEAPLAEQQVPIQAPAAAQPNTPVN